MMNAMHLETSFTFVTPNVIKNVQKPQITEQTFAAAGEHITIDDASLAASLRTLAMEDMPLIKLPVGLNSHAENVEFFWLDVKKGKKTVEKIKKMLALRWIQIIWRFEQSREECNGDLLSTNLNEAAADIESFIQVRRFLLEGVDSENLQKKKRSVLLFHHSEGNAPRPE